MKIAFIGLGNMGAPMARNLIKAGHALNLFDLNQAVLKELAELGGTISSSPRDAAQGAELVITMLPAAAHVRSVWLGEDGVLAGIGQGVPAVDCSTIDPQTIRDADHMGFKVWYGDGARLDVLHAAGAATRFSPWWELRRSIELLGYAMLYRPSGLRMAYGKPLEKSLSRGDWVEAAGDDFDDLIAQHRLGRWRQSVGAKA